jgi:hypothetical protein
MSFNIKSPFINNYSSDSVDNRRISYLKNINIPLEDHLEVNKKKIFFHKSNNHFIFFL